MRRTVKTPKHTGKISLARARKAVRAAMKYRSKAVWVDELECEAPDVSQVTVLEQDDWFDTGLLDAQGNPLYRSDKIPMGIKCST